MRRFLAQPLALAAGLGLLAGTGAFAQDEVPEAALEEDPFVTADDLESGEGATEEEWQEFDEAEDVSGGPLPWHSTLESALTAAGQNDTGVLILFSGDTFAARRFEETLRDPEVTSWLLNEFELHRVDYRAERPFAHRHSVREFPYIVVYNRFGYTVGHAVPVNDPDALFERLAPFKQGLF